MSARTIFVHVPQGMNATVVDTDYAPSAASFITGEESQSNFIDGLFCNSSCQEKRRAEADSLRNKSNADLQLAQAVAALAAAQTDANKNNPPSFWAGTGGKVTIIAGGLLLVGILIFFLIPAKK